jgi:hypothetical protein
MNLLTDLCLPYHKTNLFPQQFPQDIFPRPPDSTLLSFDFHPFFPFLPCQLRILLFLNALYPTVLSDTHIPFDYILKFLHLLFSTLHLTSIIYPESR